METHRSPMKLEARYAYYRRCQQVMRNGAQCRCPAQKGTAICRNHEEQKELAQRRMAQQQDVMRRAAEKISSETGARHSVEDLFGSPRGVQVLLSESMQALAHDRLDDRGARELLVLLQAALFRTGGLRSRGRGVPLPRMAMPRRMVKSGESDGHWHVTEREEMQEAGRSAGAGR